MSATDLPRLGIVLSTVTEGPPQEFVDIGQLAEQHGYESVFVNEGRGDAIACAEAIALGTQRIVTGTNIANIYFRHPFLAAATTRTVVELSAGRFILGLGMSHRALLRSLDIDMGDARETLRTYTSSVRAGLRGEAGSGFLKQPAAAFPLSYLPQLLDAARNAHTDEAAFGCILSIPTFVSDDKAAARSAARYNLAFFSQLPNYRRQWRRAGFTTAMDAARASWAEGSRHAAAKQIPDELIDEVCVYGTAARCRAQLQAFRDAGADVPLLAVSPVNDDRLSATRKAIVALAPGR